MKTQKSHSERQMQHSHDLAMHRLKVADKKSEKVAMIVGVWVVVAWVILVFVCVGWGWVKGV